MEIDKVNRRRAGTIQKLIRLGEARIRDQTCFRWSIRGEGGGSFVNVRLSAMTVWNPRETGTFIHDKHQGKSVPPFDTTTIRGFALVESDTDISWPRDRFQIKRKRQREPLAIIFDFRLFLPPTSARYPRFHRASPKPSSKPPPIQRDFEAWSNASREIPSSSSIRNNETNGLFLLYNSVDKRKGGGKLVSRVEEGKFLSRFVKFRKSCRKVAVGIRE